MRIEDLCILGRASPDRLKDGRETVCVAGYSNQYGFIRVYPTKVTSPLIRWNIVSVEVERDTRDTRHESWKIVGSKREWSDLDKKITVVGEVNTKDKENIIVNHLDQCVHGINEDKRSLGIIKPIVDKCYFGIREGYNPYIQKSLIAGILPIKTKENFPLVPRIRYRCSSCRAKGFHDQQVIDWGFYEWIRKNSNNKDQVWENAKIKNSSSDIYFLVGNQMIHRLSFMIISVLSIPRKKANNLNLDVFKSNIDVHDN